MWLQLRLYLLIGLMFAILYGFILGIMSLMDISGFFFYGFCGAFALSLVIIQYIAGPKMVDFSMRVKYVGENEYPKLHSMIAELADEAGIPKPRVGISKVQIPNAFAFGRSKKDARVCVTNGILKLLNEDELKAVLGHELSHIKHRDVAVITTLSVVPMICYFIFISFFWGGMISGRERGNMAIIGLIALAVYFITSLLVMYGSRIREYYADLGSVELGNRPSQLATALYKLVYGSAKIKRKSLRQVEGMKAFFMNDPSRARSDIIKLKEIDLDMSGTIDEYELIVLREKKVRINRTDKMMEILSTHPNMVKRIKHLSSLV